jgi:hypothetical protein
MILDIRQQPVRPSARRCSAGAAAVVITAADQGPAVMGLAADIGLRRLMLGVERVELRSSPYSVETRV